MDYLHTYPYDVIADKHVDQQTLLSAIHALGDVVEPPAFWSAIANDPEYRPDHRRICVFQLFKRHAREGMHVYQLAHTLDKPTWLKAENIFIVRSLHGKIPVALTPDDTVFFIRIGLPTDNNSAVYMRIAGKDLDQKDLFNVLKDLTDDQKHGDAIVLEIGYSESD